LTQEQHNAVNNVWEAHFASSFELKMVKFISGNLQVVLFVEQLATLRGSNCIDSFRRID